MPSISVGSWRWRREIRPRPGLLDTYQAERHPIAQGVLRGTHLGTRLFLAQNPLMRAVREHAVPAIVNVPPVRQRILAAVSQLTIGYRGSFLSVNADDRDEARGWLRRHAGGFEPANASPMRRSSMPAAVQPVALFDLISQGWTLLIFPGNQATPETIGALERIARQVQRSCWRCGPLVPRAGPARNGGAAAAALLDPAREVANIFGARQGLVALVRPDGYLGYRGRLDQPGELASYLARVFAMRLREAEIGPILRQ